MGGRRDERDGEAGREEKRGGEGGIFRELGMFYFLQELHLII